MIKGFKFSSLRHSKGFTLVEIMITVMVLTLALLTSISVFSKCHHFLSEVRERAIATQILKNKIENLRNSTYTAVVSSNGTFTSQGFGLLHNTVGKIDIDDPSGDPDIRKITVTLGWKSSAGRDNSQELVTMFTNRGINGK